MPQNLGRWPSGAAKPHFGAKAAIWELSNGVQHRPTAPLSSLISPSLSARALAKRPDITAAGPVSSVSRSLQAIRNPVSDALKGYLALSANRNPTRRSETRFARTTSRVVANSSPRRKQERRVLHEGASFALFAGISRGGPGRAVAACLAVLTGGSPGRPAGRLDRPKVSPGLSAGGCRVKTGSGPLERSLPPGSGALGRQGCSVAETGGLLLSVRPR
jgi:hypothetical protein